MPLPSRTGTGFAAQVQNTAGLIQKKSCTVLLNVVLDLIIVQRGGMRWPYTAGRVRPRTYSAAVPLEL